ncbi:thiol-disulfide isomerase/thioredoxin [Luteimonas cucumeris]|uniref:Thiol-disulfide isomerase/thioredoxin n=1 Tax=Luteimonas cucumeris TaxID=985012 RepID=A0A562KWW2_9GAMM|nr:TlpA disulfide reductase family protein [Luteimonas cucumeris]TWH99919.1 thiol-disulfide isomerase/thioredoxin [Luteimonas cucumeris]
MLRRWLLAAALLLCAQGSVAGQAPEIGATPPPLLGKDRDGNAVDLNALRGKVVIVTFWASWCGYCLKELPELNSLQAQAGDQWLKIIAVNVKDDTADYRAMMKQMRDYTLVMTRDRDGEIAEGYGVKGYPNLWMIDPQGRVASHHVGYGEDSLASIIDEIKRLLHAELARQQAAKTG